MSDSAPLLSVVGLEAGYGASRVLFGIDINVPSVGVVAVVGRNGAGKTTLLRAVMGYHRSSVGRVLLDGEDVTGLETAHLIRRGVGYVPQDAEVFAGLTVRENLVVGLRAMFGQARARGRDLEPVLDLFPALAARLDQRAGTLSGGERKMLGIGRALLGRPRLLVMDEPTEGVWPTVVDEIGVRLAEYSTQNAVLLVEQRVDFALDLATSVVLMERGEVVVSGSAAQLQGDPRLRSALT